MFHQKQKGPVNIKVLKGLNKTNAVVLYLLNQMPKQPYCVWLDNLFTSHNLMALLREKGYRAAGTSRANSGVVQDLIDKKDAEKIKNIFSRGSLFKATSSDNKVCQLTWKDNGFFSRAPYIQETSVPFNTSQNVSGKPSQNPKHIGRHLVTRLEQSFLYWLLQTITTTTWIMLTGLIILKPEIAERGQ